MAIGLYEFIVDTLHDGINLKTFLRRECGLSARSMTILKYSFGNIMSNGKELRAHDILHEGEKVTVTLPREHSDIEPVEGILDILYEDDCLLIINKPAAMPVHPTKVHQLDTLANIVAFHQQKRGEDYLFRSLNRLDKNTSGCVIIAKDRVAYSLVKPTIQKKYIAVCEGIVEQEGTINAPITLSPDSTMKRCVSTDGAEAVTYYKPLLYGNGHTLCELWLETGRTHQIRCHMSHIGHPLAGDDLYGGGLDLISRQALHCQSVELLHPLSHQRMCFTTDVPQEFYAVISE